MTTPTGDAGAAGDAGAGVVRRLPFSDNPTVGLRGQRTQQRILDAALRVLRDQGYHRWSVDQITKQAGCSRAAFYQYFSAKEDVYYDLARQVSRQVRAAAEGLEQLKAGPEGWATLRAWVARSGDIFERYRPVFSAFEAAAADAAPVAAIRGTDAANVTSIRAKLPELGLSEREVDAVLTTLLACMIRTFHLAGVLRSAAAATYPRHRIEDALTDVVHRTLFGLQPAVNARPSGWGQPPRLAFGAMTDMLLREGHPRGRLGEAGPTVDSLLAAGRDVFIQRGYHGARVDDIAAAAGLSHGAFYRYFKNKDDFAHVLVLQAMRPLSGALASIPRCVAPGAAGTAALRRWLRRYNASHVHEAAIIRVWVDATAPDAALGSDAAPAIDWGRRRLAHFLRPCTFGGADADTFGGADADTVGDTDADAVVMVALVDAFGSHPRPASTVDAVARIIQRGLLGQ